MWDMTLQSNVSEQPATSVFMVEDEGLRYRRKFGKYRVFREQADWTLTHTSHKDTEQSTIEASITLDGVTLTDSLIR
jgi:hypothetical protein